MAYSFLLKDEALKEFTEAIIWYEDQQEGLGRIFREKFYSKLTEVCKNPLHYRNSYKKYREALTDTFPFLIVYFVDETKNTIVVVGIFHTSRNPKTKFRKI